MRCPRCGNENAATNRFCGMCGATLVAAPASGTPPAHPPSSSATTKPATPIPSSQSAPQSTRAVSPMPSAPPAPKAPPAPRTSPEASHSSDDTDTVISGPSFLGLNKPSKTADAVHDRSARGASDPLQTSRNLDYLLDEVQEEEDEPKHGWGKLFLIVIALALALGFGYLHWKQGGFDWVTGGDKKPAATDANAPAANDSTATNANAPQTTVAQPNPATPNSAQTNTGAAPANAANSSNPSTTTSSPSSGAPTANTDQAPPSQSPTPEAPASDSNPPTPTSTKPAANTKPSPKPTPDADNNSDNSADDSDSTPAPVNSKPTPIAKPRKPSAAVPAADPVTEAERYLYGRGIAQDCDRGLHLLKSAADQANSRAMISLGSAYSTGTCAPRDLPTAYRWFAMALHKDPDNARLQDDLQRLWGQMTAPERQLAIKLSQ